MNDKINIQEKNGIIFIQMKLDDNTYITKTLNQEEAKTFLSLLKNVVINLSKKN